MTAFEPLPHLYPFRFVDRTVEKSGPASGRVRAAATANARLLGSGAASAALLAELIAQSALLLEGSDPEIGRSGFLAGISDFEVARAPEPGDLLTVSISIAGALGPAVKFLGVVTDDAGREVARGGVTVRKGTPPA